MIKQQTIKIERDSKRSKAAEARSSKMGSNIRPSIAQNNGNEIINEFNLSSQNLVDQVQKS